MRDQVDLPAAAGAARVLEPVAPPDLVRHVVGHQLHDRDLLEGRRHRVARGAEDRGGADRRLGSGASSGPGRLLTIAYWAAYSSGSLRKRDPAVGVAAGQLQHPRSLRRHPYLRNAVARQAGSPAALGHGAAVEERPDLPQSRSRFHRARVVVAERDDRLRLPEPRPSTNPPLQASLSVMLARARSAPRRRVPSVTESPIRRSVVGPEPPRRRTDRGGHRDRGGGCRNSGHSSGWVKPIMWSSTQMSSAPSCSAARSAPALSSIDCTVGSRSPSFIRRRDDSVGRARARWASATGLPSQPPPPVPRPRNRVAFACIFAFSLLAGYQCISDLGATRSRTIALRLQYLRMPSAPPRRTPIPSRPSRPSAGRR